MTLRRLPAAAAAATLLILPVGSADAQTAAPDIPLDAVESHLDAFQGIADENDGNRALGTPGYQGSVDYVKGKLQSAGYDVTVQTVPTPFGETQNVVADMTGSTSGPVVMLGGHLDSVADGPGINDNGSGAAGILQTALTYAESGEKPRNTLRFAFWGGEEQGLLGSTHYVDSLSEDERGKINAYVNVDMIGSPNSAYFVYDDNDAGNFIRDDLTKYYGSKGINSEYVDVNGRSDHAAFREHGIPTGGVFSGAEETKTEGQAKEWGGTAGEPFDPCYHQSCDGRDNIDPKALDQHADALGHILWTYAGKDFSATSAHRSAA